jgi:molybdopterin molybdotransferase
MVTVQEARNIVLSHARVLPAEEILMDRTVGFVLAEDLISSVNIPSFRQSSMDGYAIRIMDIDKELSIQDELPAGTSKQISLSLFSTIKVFTGGPVPHGADTVVQKEKVIFDGNSIRINATDLETGDNIRLPGTEISKGVLAIPSGTVINPMHIGFMASLGITKLSVIRKPSVAIIITGNEVVQPGNTLAPGQIYDSNSFGLKACLQQLHIHQVLISYAKDDLAETESTIAKALAEHDLVLITGGVSVGDYDHVANACMNLGVQKHFHGVKQRPGKPLFFGTKENKFVFGLPGNPASVMSCFYQYVLPAIHVLSGITPTSPLKAKLAATFEKKAPLTFFLKGSVANGEVLILERQASFQLSPFVLANCWIELPETKTIFEKGEEVNIHPFIA